MRRENREPNAAEPQKTKKLNLGSKKAEEIIDTFLAEILFVAIF
jgi:hypothetical protein